MDNVVPQDHRTSIETALKEYQTHREQRYAAVTVLILSWKDTDLKLDEEFQALESLFQKTFNYHVKRYEIPSERPQYQLGHHINNFLPLHGVPGNLVIVYYGGHGGPPKNGSTECEWAAYV